MMNRRQFGKRLSILLGAVAFTASQWIGVGVAQETPISILGRVEWISGQVMVIAPDGMSLAPSGAGAVNVDLAQVDQDEYHGLVTGDLVLVTGTVPNERNRIIATSIQRLAS